ncbi:MAG: magnesium chelatase [candidate division KSB1 bacterium]|nr:magnesium chelatase [candidate division KSB1 bacterium]MDZ7301425.1 magnesium chelatase [candidate division KSB1 bacterium]MDZ7313457.1 magnesium chelatase [candidate division KSB1 bacterium]
MKNLLNLRTIGQLRASGYQVISVKDEVRNNLIEKIRRRETLFPGIIGYEDTVIPELCNAILSRHDFVLLGLRGQAKSRILRALPNLLDEYIPIIKGCEINDNPYKPVCKACTDKVREFGDEVEIEWIGRDRRYGEKLATPDVTIADLIGDIDPIKAAAQRLHYAHEGIIHFGIIPRTNRGIFAINELPDLQPRIQVGLFNVMQEKDIQIRGFPIRIPLDVMIVYSANPEDYTNRGNIITPLKDRIGSQIHTHYPRTVEIGMQITAQEAWLKRNGMPVKVPYFLRQAIEQLAVEARRSEFVDQKSGVSTRLTITCLENMVSNAERRAYLCGENEIITRVCDLYAALSAVTGKIELVYEGEQEGVMNVAKALLGKAIKQVFLSYFPEPYGAMKKGQNPYQQIVAWFKNDRKIDIADVMTSGEYIKRLNSVSGLKELTLRYLPGAAEMTPLQLAVGMEFVLDGLHQNSMLSRDEMGLVRTYSDMIKKMFSNISRDEEEEEEV